MKYLVSWERIECLDAQRRLLSGGLEVFFCHVQAHKKKQQESH